VCRDGQDESQVSVAAKESSDTSEDLSDDAALVPGCGVVSLPNGIPASSVDGTKDVSSLKSHCRTDLWGGYSEWWQCQRF